MDLATLTLFLPACFALNMAPGPNNLLSVSNATRYGYRSRLPAGIGRILAFAGMIALAGAGLSVVLQTSEWLFHAIKIVGAAYLLYLAWQLWRANPEAEQQVTRRDGGFLALARQEFLVAAGNPKAILLFTAFLPQFVDPAARCRRNSPCSARCFCCWNGSPSAPTRGWACTCAAGSPSRAANGSSIVAAQGCCRRRLRCCCWRNGRDQTEWRLRLFTIRVQRLYFSALDAISAMNMLITA